MSTTSSVVVLETSVGEDLFIRGNPTDDEVRSYVEEQTKRYIAGGAAGPSGIPAFRVFNAKRYPSEGEFYAGADVLGEIEISDLLPTP